jgi:glutamate-1-semialdehyde aminotransferase
MMCSDWDGIKPDILILGKALSGGTMPVSAVLANDEVCQCQGAAASGAGYQPFRGLVGFGTAAIASFLLPRAPAVCLEPCCDPLDCVQARSARQRLPLHHSARQLLASALRTEHRGYCQPTSFV